MSKQDDGKEMVTISVPAGFHDKYKVNPETGCWEWGRSITKNGYGHVSVNRKLQYAHRVAYSEVHGGVPAGMVLDHLCRVRHCCNPQHLEAVSSTENVLRGTGFAAVNSAKTHCIRGHGWRALQMTRQMLLRLHSEDLIADSGDSADFVHQLLNEAYNHGAEQWSES